MEGIGKFGELENQPKSDNIPLREPEDAHLEDDVVRNVRIPMENTGIGRMAEPKKNYSYRESCGVKSAGGYEDEEVRTKP